MVEVEVEVTGVGEVAEVVMEDPVGAADRGGLATKEEMVEWQGFPTKVVEVVVLVVMVVMLTRRDREASALSTTDFNLAAAEEDSQVARPRLAEVLEPEDRAHQEE